MTNTMLCRKLFVVAAPPMISDFCCKLFLLHPFHFGNVFSTEAHSQTLFSHFASSKFHMSEADIIQIFKFFPKLQKLPTLHNVEKVIHSLKKRGCSEDQIAHIVRMNPAILGIAERILEPKIKLLEDFGFVDRNLAKILSKNPRILSKNLKNNLLPKMKFLKNVFQSQDVFVTAVTRAPRILNTGLESLKPSLAFWEGWGFCGTGLLIFLRLYPDVLSHTSLTPAQVDLIRKIGAREESKMYKYIVGIVATRSTKTLEANIENLKLCGLSAEETWQLLRAVPLVVTFSKENVREKMKFLVNTMELPPNYVVKHPALLQVSLEKTMKPRFLVWQKIKSINALELPLSTVLRMAETRFVNNIIKGHPESKILWTIYENAISNATNRTTQQNINLDGESESEVSKTTTNILI